MNNEPDSRALLILDLDETLIFGSEQKLPSPFDFQVGPFFVYERPYLADFLRQANQEYDLAVWSSATFGYVGGIAHRLRQKYSIDWRFVWSRGHCVQKYDPEWFEHIYLKDIRKTRRFGYAKERVLIVDDTRKKVSRNYGNAIYPTQFTGKPEDDELKYLGIYLKSLSHETNFRTIEKRDWREKAERIAENENGG